MRKFYLFLLSLIFTQGSAQLNIDFEQSTPGQYTGSTSVSGWTVQNLINTGFVCATGEPNWSYVSNPDFYIRQTPILNHPYLGTIPQSPLGGNHVAQLLDVNGSGAILRLSQTFNVTSNNCLLQYAICGSLDGANHICCDRPFARFEVVSCNSGPVSCLSNTISGDLNCGGTTTMLVGSNGVFYTNWQVKTVDLSPFIGTCVTIRFTVGDCIAASHHGSFYFDAKTSAQNVSNGLSIITNPGPNSVNFCAGSGVAIIQAPLGYSTYSWVPPSGYPSIPAAQATLSTGTFTNPTAGSVFSVYLTTPANCQYIATYTIAYSTANIAAVGTTSTCSNGSSGSATVQGTGSSIGYSYAWYNSSNSVVSTSSVLSNVAAGVYSVHLLSAGCGSAVTTVTVGVNTSPLTYVSKPFCGTTAYLGVTGGSNYQWYSGTSSISATSGGQASSYTVTNASSNNIYYLAYTNSQGCKDSVKYTLYPSTPGPLLVSSNTVCVGSANGNATISLPSNSTLSGNNYFIVNSVSPTPSYNASVSTTATTFTLANLVGAGQYTIEAFDGSCKHTSIFTAPAYSFNFSFSPASPTICGMGSVQAILVVSGPITSNGFTYNWSPPLFLSNTTSQTPVVSPTVAANTSSFITYSVVVTPTVLNCPLTKTYTVHYSNPATPTIVPLTPVCKNSGTVSLTASPGPGYFIGNPAVSATGEFTPALASVGISSVTYVYSLNGCSASQTSTLSVQPSPTLQITGKKTLCSGDSTLLTASGAVGYSWSGGATGSTLHLTPPASMSVLVTGTSATGCSSSTLTNIIVINTPSVQASNQVICMNQSATLTASGADTYSWNTGATSSLITVFPIATTHYTVTGKNSGLCTQAKVVTVTVTPYPVLAIAGKTAVCIGDQTTFTVSGANTYSWSTGSTASVVSIVATGSKFYTVYGINNPGNCGSNLQFNLNAMACTGIDEYDTDLSLQVFPNPNAGEFFVTAAEPGKLVICDPLGKVIIVKDLNAPTNTISMKDCSSGMYHLKYTTKDRSYTKKIWVGN